MALSLRHTFCTRRLLEGSDLFSLSKRVGTSVKMLEDYYGHVTAIGLSEAKESRLEEHQAMLDSILEQIEDSDDARLNCLPPAVMPSSEEQNKQR
jgi:hypothetical protein